MARQFKTMILRQKNIITIMNDEANCTTYGGLYDWATAMNGGGSCDGPNITAPACPTPVQGICPAGFHIPSHYEWYTLAHYLDNTYPDLTMGFQGTDCGTKLKNGGSSGFLALYGGYYTSALWEQGYSGYFWTSYQTWPLPPGVFDTYLYGVNNDNTGVDMEGWVKTTGLSVRCIKN